MSTHQDGVSKQWSVVFRAISFLLLAWYTNCCLSRELWELIAKIHGLATGCLLPYIQRGSVYINEDE